LYAGRIMRISLLLLAALVLPSFGRAADNWPQFRGPHGANRADSADPPVVWGEEKNVVWKTAIHDKGWSSPVVWGDQVWVTTARADGKHLFAVCLDRNSGKIVHDVTVFEVGRPAFCHPQNSYASPTPAIEEGRVYVHFGTYGTACLDTHSGKVLWSRRDLHCDHWRGPASSPILYGGLLFVPFDGFDVQYVVALDKATGKTVWKKDRNIDYKTDNGDLKKAYGTPTVITVEGKPQLVSSSATATIAYELRSGDELWRVYHGGMNTTAPPLYGLGKVFLCTGDGGLGLLAVRPDGRGDLTESHIEWSTKQGVPSRSSPVLVEDQLIMVTNDGGIVSCLDARTGKRVWQTRLGGRYWASPLYAGGRLYLCSEEGTTFVGEGGRAWKKLAANKLAGEIMSCPAPVGKALYLRTKTHLYRIEQKD
jgi:outer membrane protein assembly factor BamB